MRGFTAHEARGRNLPLTSPKVRRRRFCCGGLLFHAGRLISGSHLAVFVTVTHAVEDFVSVRKHSGFDLRLSEKLCVEFHIMLLRNRITNIEQSVTEVENVWNQISHLLKYL